MATIGTVREWDDGAGLGVIDSAETPGGCWVHWSHITAAGYRTLEVGQTVEFDWQPVRQDGYDFQAVRVQVAPLRP